MPIETGTKLPGADAGAAEAGTVGDAAGGEGCVEHAIGAGTPISKATSTNPSTPVNTSG